MVARLALHLPRGEYLRQLSRGLLLGRIGYAAAAVIAPRLQDASAPPAYRTVQVAVNDAARTITGRRRADHIRIPDLLHRAGLPSVNALAVRAVAMECWKAFHSSDGENGERNPIGEFMFQNGKASERTSRSKKAGMVTHPLRVADTFAVHALDIWNRSPELRDAATRRAAATVAKTLARSAPV